MTNPYASAPGSSPEAHDKLPRTPEQWLRMRAYIRSATVFLICLALIWLSPLLVDVGQPFLPTIVENFLYFLPLHTFPYKQFGISATFASWGTVAVLFSYLTHRFSNLLLLMIGALSTIVLLTIVGSVLFDLFGFEFHLVGP